MATQFVNDVLREGEKEIHRATARSNREIWSISDGAIWKDLSAGGFDGVRTPYKELIDFMGLSTKGILYCYHTHPHKKLCVYSAFGHESFLDLNHLSPPSPNDVRAHVELKTFMDFFCRAPVSRVVEKYGVWQFDSEHLDDASFARLDGERGGLIGNPEDSLIVRAENAVRIYNSLGIDLSFRGFDGTVVD